MREQVSSHRYTILMSGMLLAFVAASLVSGTAQAAVPDHYACYKIKELKKTCLKDGETKCKGDEFCVGLGEKCVGFPKNVSGNLLDDFADETVEIKKPTQLCPPVDKDGEGIRNAIIHMLRYKIKGAKPQNTVLVRDQYGDHILRTGKADSLLVPTTKGLVGGMASPSSDHDSYKCYRVKDVKNVCTGDLKTKCTSPAACQTAGGTCATRFLKGTIASLEDQFLDTDVVLKKLRLLCTPVDKDFQGIVNSVHHLLGYQISGGSPLAKRAWSNNDFGLDVVQTIKQEFLFVPALKIPGPEAACGDGVVNQLSELCDSNGDDTLCPGECSLTCTCPVCGDGVAAGDEECDGELGDEPNNPCDGRACQSDCTCPPTCGDNLREVGEVLGISPETVKTDWRTARAWLRTRLEVGE